MLATMRRPSSHKSQGRSCRRRLVGCLRWGGVNQLRADIVADAPDDLVALGNCVPGQAQPKFVGDLVSDRSDPYAAIGHFRDEAVPRRISSVGDHGGEIFDAPALRTASFLTHSPWFSGCRGCIRLPISLGLTRSLEFIGQLIKIGTSLKRKKPRQIVCRGSIWLAVGIVSGALGGKRPGQVCHGSGGM